MRLITFSIYTWDVLLLLFLIMVLVHAKFENGITRKLLIASFVIWFVSPLVLFCYSLAGKVAIPEGAEKITVCSCVNTIEHDAYQPNEEIFVHSKPDGTCDVYDRYNLLLKDVISVEPYRFYDGSKYYVDLLRFEKDGATHYFDIFRKQEVTLDNYTPQHVYLPTWEFIYVNNYM